MKFIRACALVVLSCLIFTLCGRADVIVDNLGQPTEDYLVPIGDNSNSTGFLIGQEFSFPPGTNRYQLNEVDLSLGTYNNANITVSIWGVGPDNNPSNEIATVTSELVTNFGDVDFFPFTNIVLS